MKGELTGFLIYMLSMLGVIFIAIIVAKKTFFFNFDKQKNRFLKIESSINLEPRKNLYVVKAGYERFLISTGLEGCQFMAKIDEDNIPGKPEAMSANVVESPDINIIDINKAKNFSLNNGGR